MKRRILFPVLGLMGLVSLQVSEVSCQSLGPFANVGTTLDATEVNTFILLHRAAMDTNGSQQILAEITLMSVLNATELPSASTDMPIPLTVAERNRLFNPNNPLSLVSRLAHQISYDEARSRERRSPRWVRNVGALSATDEIQSATIRRIYFDRLRNLDRPLPPRR